MTGYNELDVEEIFEEDFEFLVIEENLIDLSFIIEEDELENEAIRWYSQCQITARCFLVAMIFLSFLFFLFGFPRIVYAKGFILLSFCSKY